MAKGITIVGLGPGDPGLLTVEADRVLRTASCVYLRTSRHPTVAALPATLVLHSFDDVYERCATFDDVYRAIAERVVELGGSDEGVVYAVPGHPLVGESTVSRVLRLAEADGLPVRIVEGLSFIESVAARLKIDLLDGAQIVDATEMAQGHYPQVNPDRGLLIGQLYSRELAADLKLLLMTVYPDQHPVTLVRAAGSESSMERTVPLFELDRQEDIDHLTTLYVPRLAQTGSLEAFQEVVARLRAPDGCPWDKAQTHASLRQYLLEETYEVLQALDAGDTDSLVEELGDLLLQILLHTQVAIEDDEFGMRDVVARIVAKLIRRHPHVFGGVRVSNAAEVLVNWQQIKSLEKDHSHDGGTLAGISQAMPALARAQALQERAARVGFDWQGIDGVWAKVEEELQELRAAPDGEARESELGDVLFSLVNLARWYHADAESTLRQSTARFEGRFLRMEQELAALGRPAQGLSPAEWDVLWESAKRKDG